MTIRAENSKRYRRKAKKCVQNICSIRMLKKKLPIIGWLPNYKASYILQDCIAGITVALTAIPQGIAFAVMTGLSPEYGLYASLTCGVVYVFFGSCYNVTVGPTAILASMTARYVSDYSPDFAIFAAFSSGVLILLLGVLNLGFLVEFISKPVISGFMNAAALQIASSQLKPFLGLSGVSGNYFAESVYNVFKNIRTTRLGDSILSVSTVIMLVLLKKMGEGCKRTDGIIKKIRWFVSISRNAVVVIIGAVIAYSLKVIYDSEPLIIVGDIGSGLPKFGWPPLSTTVGNETIYFVEMIQILGMQSIVIPFVAILETVAIAKAFAVGGRIDASQELIAIGICNIVGSCGQSMPITGSFARTAINHVSGVKTPAGGVTKVLVIIIALTYLTSAFYYIPKATLGAVIITALFFMIDYQIVISLWKNSIRELLVFSLTMIICLFFGLEYGIIAGILTDALILLFFVARPSIGSELLKSDKGDVMVVTLSENVSYCAVEHVRQKLIKAATHAGVNVPIILNGVHLKELDFTAAFNLMSLIQDLDKTCGIILLNFDVNIKKMCLYIDSKFESKFMYAKSPQELTDNFPKEV